MENEKSPLESFEGNHELPETLKQLEQTIDDFARVVALNHKSNNSHSTMKNKSKKMIMDMKKTCQQLAKESQVSEKK